MPALSHRAFEFIFFYSSCCVSSLLSRACRSCRPPFFFACYTTSLWCRTGQCSTETPPNGWTSCRLERESCQWGPRPKQMTKLGTQRKSRGFLVLSHVFVIFAGLVLALDCGTRGGGGKLAWLDFVANLVQARVLLNEQRVKSTRLGGGGGG